MVSGTLGWIYATSRRSGRGEVWRQGSKAPLLIKLTVFATKYTSGYAMEAQPDLVVSGFFGVPFRTAREYLSADAQSPHPK